MVSAMMMLDVEASAVRPDSHIYIYAAQRRDQQRIASGLARAAKRREISGNLTLDASLLEYSTPLGVLRVSGMYPDTVDAV